MRLAKPKRQQIPRAGLFFGVAVAFGAQAQEAGPANLAGLGLRVVATAGVSETITSNSRLTASRGSAEAITQLNAGIRAAGRTGSVTGSLDYSLSGLVYSTGDTPSSHQNSLNAQVSAELVDKWAFLDASAFISQQSISAFGQPSTTDGFFNPNRTEVRGIRLSPSIRGNLFGIAKYEARLTHSMTRAASSKLGDSTSDTESVSLSSPGSGPLGWNLSLTSSASSFGGIRSTRSSQLAAGLTYLPMPEVRLVGSYGREFSDLITTSSTSSAYWRMGVDLKPNERTNLNATYSKRFFGSAWQVSISHRLPRTFWTFSSSRNLSNTSANVIANSTAYDLLFAQLAAIEPDVIKRAELILAELSRAGISANTLIPIGFLTSGVSIVTQHQLSATLQAQRANITGTVFSTESKSVGQQPVQGGDLARSAFVRQSGFSVNIGHRLTPSSSLSASSSWNRTQGSAAGQGNRISTHLLSYSAQLGLRTAGSLTLRHASFSSPTDPYTEDALVARLDYRF